MSKYEKLGSFLNDQVMSEIPVTFAEIERIIGCPLPRSSRYPAWWSNNPSNNVMTKIWLDAGYKTEQVNIEAQRLVFRRVAEAGRVSRDKTGETGMTEDPMTPATTGMADAARNFTAVKSSFGSQGHTEISHPIHPAFGSMKGLISIAPGVDLTEPAAPDWGTALEKKYGKHGRLP